MTPPRMAVASSRRWVAFVVGREALILWFCLLGSWLFLNHGLLYLQPRAEVVSAPPQAYALTTAVIYVFIRGVSLVAETRLPPHPAMRSPQRGAEIVPVAVQPVRRIVAVAQPAGGATPGTFLRNAVVTAQAVLPTHGAPAPSSLSALPDEHQGDVPAPRLLREPWRPPWMEDRPRRR